MTTYVNRCSFSSTNEQTLNQMANNTSTNPVTGIRLKDEERLFLEEKFPGVAYGKAIQTLLAQTMTEHSQPKNVQEAKERLTDYLNISLMPSDGSRSVVAEDLIREAVLILATAKFGAPEPGINNSEARIAFEQQLIERAFDFMDTLLRHTLPEDARTWDPQVVRERLMRSRRTLAESLSHTSAAQRPRNNQE